MPVPLAAACKPGAALHRGAVQALGVADTLVSHPPALPLCRRCIDKVATGAACELALVTAGTQCCAAALATCQQDPASSGSYKCRMPSAETQLAAVKSIESRATADASPKDLLSLTDDGTAGPMWAA